MNATANQFFSLTLAIAFVLSSANFASSQTRAFSYAYEFDFSKDKDVESQVESCAQLERDRILARFLSMSADISRACEMTELETRKLSVRSRRVYQRWLASRKHNLDAAIKRASRREAKELSFFLNDGTNVDWFVMWDKNISEYLGEKHHDAYQKWKNERFAAHQAVAVRRFVTRCDTQLMLSQDQRVKLEKIVDEIAGKHFGWLDLTETPTLYRSETQIFGSTSSYSDQVKDILSEQQLSGWERSFDRELYRTVKVKIPVGIFDSE